jgi:hypothetical protein
MIKRVRAPLHPPCARGGEHQSRADHPVPHPDPLQYTHIRLMSVCARTVRTARSRLTPTQTERSVRCETPQPVRHQRQ